MKKTIKYIGFIFVGIILTYIISVFVLPYITVKGTTVQTLREINIYIKSNGVHTDIVVPIKNKYYNWNTKIKQKHTKLPSEKMKYVGIGWGDKGFYLNTPTWSDLTVKTALTAALGRSSTALHTTYYPSMKETNDCVKLSLTNKQYIKLCNYIEKSALIHNNEFVPIKTTAYYGNHDAFYEANGVYHLFKTCNTWTNTALKVCGQNACLWTITDNEILTKNK